MNLAQRFEELGEAAKVDPLSIPIRDASPVLQQLRLFRISSDGTTTTTTTSTTSTSTTSTTTTSTTTTTPAPCFGRVWRGIAIDAQFPSATGFQALVTIERSQDSYYLFSPVSLAIRLHDIVIAACLNNVWIILEVYGNCPQSGVTTTTTTSTTTTSSTTPAPGTLPS